MRCNILPTGRAKVTLRLGDVSGQKVAISWMRHKAEVTWYMISQPVSLDISVLVLGVNIFIVEEAG